MCETIGFYEIGWRGHTTKRTPPSYETKEEVAVPNLMELEQAKMGIVLMVDDEYEVVENSNSTKGVCYCFDNTAVVRWQPPTLVFRQAVGLSKWIFGTSPLLLQDNTGKC